MESAAPRPAVLVLLGSTAAGKTAYALELGERFGGEVVSQDSRQVYRGMVIGTAKPTPEERRRVPHHGLDLVEPDETWTLAQQQRVTTELVDALAAGGRLPMLVGGTGQYLRAILEGWTVPEVPPNEPLRARLREEAERLGAPALHERLRDVDPVAAERIMPNDLRRITRALEVWEATGRPLSEQQRAEPPPWDVLTLGLRLPREELYARIDWRADGMLEGGLLEEIRGLRGRGYDWSLPAMRTIGYGEFRPYFEEDASLEACVQRLKWDTHEFARRQEVWFRRFQDVRWLDPRSDSELRGGIEHVERWLSARASGANDGNL